MPVILGSIYNDRLKKLSRKGWSFDRETNTFISNDIKMFPANLKRQFGIDKYFVKKASKTNFNNILRSKKLL